jgi:proteasome lid subunit RPN8/RPN11
VILVPRQLLKEMVDAAEAAYPDECCGLLAGHVRDTGEIVVSRLQPSPNVATGDPHRRFEVDPQIRFDLMREVGDGPERIVGHYHSHPGEPAQPSAHDLESAWEPDLVWLITAVVDGQAIHTTAHALDADARQFRQIGLRTTDWQPYPIRPARSGEIP